MHRIRSCLALFLFALALAPDASAARHPYRLEGVVFDDGTVATGTFVYDDALVTVVQWYVEVRGNDVLLPFAYMPGDSVVQYDPSVWPTLVFSSVEGGAPHMNGVSERQFRITPTLPFGGPAATIPLDLATPSNRSGGVECLNCGAFRVIVAGALVRIPEPVSPPRVDAIEFHHATFDHYFLTADPPEIAALDSGVFSGWTRTGETFRAHAAGTYNAPPVRPVCRFYGLPSAGLDSHFYSADPAECFRVDRDYGTEWQVEHGNVFQVALPTLAGECPAATVPVYRVFNARPDANHRYTTKPAVRALMEAAGWIREGYGPDAVIMCAVDESAPTD